ADHAIDGFPRDAVLVDGSEDTGPRSHPAVSRHPRGMEHPAISLAVEVAVCIASGRIEDPRLEMPRHRVVPDPLRSGDRLLAGDGHGKAAQEIVAAVTPAARKMDVRIGAFVDPVADEPFELLHLFVMREMLVGRLDLVKAGNKPLPLFL